jgi:hypothetical protein
VGIGGCSGGQVEDHIPIVQGYQLELMSFVETVFFVAFLIDEDFEDARGLLFLLSLSGGRERSCMELDATTKQ